MDRYPILRINSLIDRLAHANYLAKIDLANVYYQLPTEPGHDFKTAFTSRLGLLEYVLM